MKNNSLQCRMLIVTLILGQVSSAWAEGGDAFQFFEEEAKVVSTGFFNTQANKAPGYVFVADQSLLEDSTARSIAEILQQYVPGVETSYHFFGSLIGQRGIEIDNNAKTDFMLDGKSLNARGHFGYMADLDVPLMGNLKSIEVVNGPGAIVHGTGAINGYIDNIPKTGKDAPGLNVTTEFGPIDDLNKIESSYGTTYDHGDVYFYFGTLQAQGYKPNTDTLALSPASSNQGTIDLINGGGYRDNVYQGDNYKIDLNWNHEKFNLLTEFMNTNSISRSAVPSFYQQQIIASGPNAGTAIPNSQQTMSALWGDTHLLVKPKYDFELGEKDHIETMVSAYLLDNCNYDINRNVCIENFAQNQTSEAEYYAESVYKTTRWDRQSLAIGTDVSRRYFYDRDPIFRSEADTLALDPYNSTAAYQDPRGRYFYWTEYAAFAEDVIQMTDKWTSSLGLRYDGVTYNTQGITTTGVTYDSQGNINGAYNNQVELDKKTLGHVSPRVALAYQPVEDTTYRLSYQQGFRDPDMVDFTANTPGSGTPNPETMDSIEANYSHVIQKHYTVDFNTYYNIMHEMIGWRTISTVQGNGSAQQTVQGFANTPYNFSVGGFELINGYKGDVTQAHLSYSFSRPIYYPAGLQDSAYGPIMEVSPSRDSFARYPEHIVKGDVSRYFFDKILLMETSASYTCGLPDDTLELTNGQLVPTPTQVSFQGGSFHLNFMARYDFYKNAFLKFTAQNLTTDQHTLPAWSANVGNGPVGLDERLYYIELGIHI